MLGQPYLTVQGAFCVLVVVKAPEVEKEEEKGQPMFL